MKEQRLTTHTSLPCSQFDMAPPVLHIKQRQTEFVDKPSREQARQDGSSFVRQRRRERSAKRGSLENTTLSDAPKAEIHTMRFARVLVMTALLGGCAMAHSGSPIQGRIVDKTTGEPVPGAVVLAVWSLAGGTFQEDLLPPIYYEETTTDASGEYTLEGFSFRLVPRYRSPIRMHMAEESPYIYVIKPGFQIIWKNNPYLWDLGFKRDSYWHNKIIHLEPLEPTRDSASRLNFKVFQLSRLLKKSGIDTRSSVCDHARNA